MNYTVGAYATFATTMAHQPPFANEQTNQESNGERSADFGMRAVCGNTCLTLAQWISGASDDRELCARSAFQLPYVQAWNVDIQKTLPWGIVMNVGYNGVEREPPGYRDGAARDREQSADGSDESPDFRYEQAAAFSSSMQERCV